MTPVGPYWMDAYRPKAQPAPIRRVVLERPAVREEPPDPAAAEVRRRADRRRIADRRRRILDAVRRQPGARAVDLIELLGLQLSTVYNDLKRLAEAGLICKSRRAGDHARYFPEESDR